MLKKILFVPDSHVPFEDKKAFNLMLKAGQQFRPDIVVILGDFADFYSVSDHLKDPSRVNKLKQEAKAVRVRLRQVEALGAKRNIFVAGNHEDRLTRYIAARAPELFGTVNIQKVLGLEGWEYVEYKDHIRLGKLYVTHDCEKAGKTALFDAQAAFESNVVIGHLHRLGFFVVGSAQGKAHVAMCPGWLGDVERVDYKHRIRARRDFVHGFGLGYMEPSGIVHCVPVPIVLGKCTVEGRLVQ